MPPTPTPPILCAASAVPGEAGLSAAAKPSARRGGLGNDFGSFDASDFLPADGDEPLSESERRAFWTLTLARAWSLRDVRVAAFAVSQGADPDALRLESDRSSLLGQAAGMGSAEWVEALLPASREGLLPVAGESGEDSGASLEEEGAASLEEEGAASLEEEGAAGLDSGARPGFREMMKRSETKNRGRNTPLMRAAEHGHWRCVELLLPRSDPCAKDILGHNALMRTLSFSSPDVDCRANKVRCAELLAPLSNGAERDRQGLTALMRAVVRKPVDAPLARAVARAGGGAELDSGGNDALRRAASVGHAELIPDLMKICDPLARNGRGETAFMLGAAALPEEGLAALGSQSDWLAKSKAGQTALDWAWKALADGANEAAADWMASRWPQTAAQSRALALFEEEAKTRRGAKILPQLSARMERDAIVRSMSGAQPSAPHVSQAPASPGETPAQGGRAGAPAPSKGAAKPRRV